MPTLGSAQGLLVDGPQQAVWKMTVTVPCLSYMSLMGSHVHK